MLRLLGLVFALGVAWYTADVTVPAMRCAATILQDPMVLHPECERGTSNAEAF